VPYLLHYDIHDCPDYISYLYQTHQFQAILRVYVILWLQRYFYLLQRSGSAFLRVASNAEQGENMKMILKKSTYFL